FPTRRSSDLSGDERADRLGDHDRHGDREDDREPSALRCRRNRCIVAVVVTHQRSPPQHVSPRHAPRPSRSATTAITRAAAESAQAQPSSAFTPRPSSRAAERYVQISVCFESATAERDPSSRPARRSEYESTGMMSRLIAASTMPTVDGSAAPDPAIDSTASAPTYVAKAKN